MTDERRLTIGFPRMYNEPGERRAFLPPLMGLLAETGVNVYVEAGCGAGMGYADDDYRAASPGSTSSTRPPPTPRTSSSCSGRRRGATTCSGPARSCSPCSTSPRGRSGSKLLSGLGIEAIALDMVTGDDGRRLVQNLREVARNGLGAAFDALERRWPPFLSSARPPVSVTILGAGGVGQARDRVGRQSGRRGARNERPMREGLPGVEVVVAEQNLAGNEAYFLRHPPRPHLHPRRCHGTPRHLAPHLPERLVDLLPEHAIVCDLAVDPYLLDDYRPVGADRGHPPGPPRPVGVRPGRSGLGPPAPGDPDQAPANGRVLLLLARRKPEPCTWRPTGRRSRR